VWSLHPDPFSSNNWYISASPSHVASIGDSSSVRVSISSADADPLYDQGSVYRGIPVSLFPTDDVYSLLGHGGSHFKDPSPLTTTLVTHAQANVPDKMNQLM
jgi:hypothetical protein